MEIATFVERFEPSIRGLEVAYITIDREVKEKIGKHVTIHNISDVVHCSSDFIKANAGRVSVVRVVTYTRSDG